MASQFVLRMRPSACQPGQPKFRPIPIPIPPVPVLVQVCDRAMETRGPELRGETPGGAAGAGARKSKFGLSPAAHAAGFGGDSGGETSGGCCG